MNVQVTSGILYKRQKPGSGVYDEAAFVPARQDDPADCYLFGAFDAAPACEDGINKALGQKIQGNPEMYECHTLILLRVVPFEPWLILEGVPRGVREPARVPYWSGH